VLGRRAGGLVAVVATKAGVRDLRAVVEVAAAATTAEALDLRAAELAQVVQRAEVADPASGFRVGVAVGLDPEFLVSTLV